MEFEWDARKNELNLANHGITLEAAAYVFADPNRLEIYDSKHSDMEDRYITIGMLKSTLCIVYVSYTPRKENVIRLISARKANARERKAYYDQKEYRLK